QVQCQPLLERLQRVEQCGAEPKAEEASSAGHLLQGATDLDEAKRQLLLTATARLRPEVADITKQPPMHVDVCLPLAIPKRVSAVKVVAAEDIDIAAQARIVLL